MTIKNRIILLTIIPLVLFTLVIMATIDQRLSMASSEQAEQLRSKLMADRQAELKNYLDMTLTAIAPFYEQNGPQAQEQAKSLMRRLRYGEDKSGYIFVYRFDGTNLVLGPNPAKEGDNMINVRDSNGKQVIKDLIDVARQGGGFYDYLWAKPGSEDPQPKLSYAVSLPKWGWMLGTGFYIDDINAQLAQQQQQADDTLTGALEILIAVAVLGIVATIAVAIYLTNRTLAPVTHSVALMDNIAQGDGDLTKRLDVDGETEIDQLAGAFNLFADKVQSTIAKVTDTADQLVVSVNEVHRASESHSQDASRQHQEIEQVAAAISEMSATAQEVARSAAEGANSANVAYGDAESGQQELHSTLTSIGELDNLLQQAESVIVTLETESENIGSVLGVIGGIAEQTNLLALNAAIEAARAGEMGRGFAVVADEVRTLASRTQDSTQEIQTMINKLQEEAARAVMVMQQSKAKSQSTVSQANKAGDSLNKITGSINTINDMNNQIATAAEEQNAVSEEINKSVNQIAELSTAISGGMQETTASADKLSGLGDDLNHLVNQFKIK